MGACLSNRRHHNEGLFKSALTMVQLLRSKVYVNRLQFAVYLGKTITISKSYSRNKNNLLAKVKVYTWVLSISSVIWA